MSSMALLPSKYMPWIAALIKSKPGRSLKMFTSCLTLQGLWGKGVIFFHAFRCWPKVKSNSIQCFFPYTLAWQSGAVLSAPHMARHTPRTHKNYITQLSCLPLKARLCFSLGGSALPPDMQSITIPRQNRSVV